MSILGKFLNGVLGGNSDEVDWYCDRCEAHLNRQAGFNTSTGSWTCEICGEVNDVTASNIIPDEDAWLIDSLQKPCPKCGGHMRKGWRYNLWECEDCGTEAEEDEFGNLWTED